MWRARYQFVGHRLRRAMRARPPMLLIATAAVLTVSLTGCEAKVYGAPAAPTPGANVPAALVSPPSVTAIGLPCSIAHSRGSTTAAVTNGVTMPIAALEK